MKKKMWFVLCIMTSVLLTTACGEKKERKNSGNIHSFSRKSCYTGCVMQGNPWICVCG